MKKKIRAEELMKASSLPPSMAAREELAKSRSSFAEMSEDGDSDRPKRRRHKIPDYKKSHEMLERELKARWNDNVTTSPQPFCLKTEQRRRKSARFESPSNSPGSSPYEGHVAYFQERLRPRSALSITPNRNNLAAILRIQSARQRLECEVSRKQEELRKKEAALLKAHLIRRQPAWRALNYSIVEDLALRVQSRREEDRLRWEEHRQDMELMLSRVRCIPTLFERQSQPMLEKDRTKKRRSAITCRHSDGSLSFNNSPDLYDLFEGRSSKTGLKVSINETADTISETAEKPNVGENVTDGEKEEQQQLVEDGDKEDSIASIQEEFSSAKSSHQDDDDNEQVTFN